MGQVLSLPLPSSPQHTKILETPQRALWPLTWVSSGVGSTLFPGHFSKPQCLSVPCGASDMVWPLCDSGLAVALTSLVNELNLVKALITSVGPPLSLHMLAAPLSI